MVTRTLASLDMHRVHEAALEGIRELALTKPDTARRIRTVLELQGGVALHVARWEDGMVGIAIAGVQVAMVPLERLLPRYDA